MSSDTQHGQHDTTTNSLIQWQHSLSNGSDATGTAKQISHIVWDLESLLIPSNMEINDLTESINKIIQLLGSNIAVSSFISTVYSGTLSNTIKQALHDNGIVVQEYPIDVQHNTVGIQFISSLLNVTVNDCMVAAATGGQYMPTLMVITNANAYSNALYSIKRSNLYNHITLLYTYQIDDTLRNSVDNAIDITSILYTNGYRNSMHTNNFSPDVYKSTSPAYEPCNNHIIAPPLQHRSSTMYNGKPLQRIEFAPEPLSQQQLLHCFHSLMSYCINEHIIPRENVLRKRLLDTKLGNEAHLEPMINAAVQAGVAYVENGNVSQRVIWPIQADGTVNRFQCVDYFQPSQRLSSEQMLNILKWLARNRPETDRGRFGYAQYLARYGPTTVRELPHGVLIELVQLLLNQKALLFKKGRIAVSPFLTVDGVMQTSRPGTPNSMSQLNNAAKLADEFAKLSFNAALPENGRNTPLLPNSAAYCGDTGNTWSSPVGLSRSPPMSLYSSPIGNTHSLSSDTTFPNSFTVPSTAFDMHKRSSNTLSGDVRYDNVSCASNGGDSVANHWEDAHSTPSTGKSSDMAHTDNRRALSN